MAEFDTGVAVPGGGSFVPPRVDFSPLADLQDAYYQGQQKQQKLSQQRVFRNGIRKDVNTGLPDYGEMADRLARTGAPPGEFVPISTAGMRLQLASGNDQYVGGGGSTAAPATGYGAKVYGKESGNDPNAKSQTST